MKQIKLLIFILAAFFLLTGFDLKNSLVPKDEILSGGVGKDGIPALLKPKFVKAKDAKFLKPKDKVMGVVINGQAKAYPLNILNWHEVVNDKIANVPFVVTY